MRAVGVVDFRPWVDAPHHVTRNVNDDYIRDWEVRSPIGVLGNLMDTLMVKPAPLFAAETLAVIDEVRPDAVAASFTLLGSLMAAEARRVPCAALVPNVVSLPAEGMPPFGTGFLPPAWPARTGARSGAQRIRRPALEQGPPRAQPGTGVTRPRAALPAARTIRAPQRILALTAAAFDFPAALPANVRYVGPQLDDPEWAEPWSPPDGDDRPFVLVAMEHHVHGPRRAAPARGNGARISPRARTRDHQSGGRPRADRGPDAVTVVRSAPHREVLAHTDVLLTHGGHGTVVKGLVAGVPIVCMPTGATSRTTPRAS